MTYELTDSPHTEVSLLFFTPKSPPEETISSLILWSSSFWPTTVSTAVFCQINDDGDGVGCSI